MKAFLHPEDTVVPLYAELTRGKVSNRERTTDALADATVPEMQAAPRWSHGASTGSEPCGFPLDFRLRAFVDSAPSDYVCAGDGQRMEASRAGSRHACLLKHGT